MTYYEKSSLTNDQKQIILGTILGGSSIVKPKKGKNCYLSMRNKRSDNLWLEYKAQELNELSSERPFTTTDTSLRWHSRCDPIFNDYHKLFYKNSKKIVTIDVLDKLSHTALAIWFRDAGILHNDEIYFKTSGFGKKGCQIISNYFKLLGYESWVSQNLRVYLSTKDSVRVIKSIANRLSNFVYDNLKLQNKF